MKPKPPVINAEWMAYVRALNQILCRDVNAISIVEMANGADQDTIAHAIGSMLRAKPWQKREALRIYRMNEDLQREHLQRTYQQRHDGKRIDRKPRTT